MRTKPYDLTDAERANLWDCIIHNLACVELSTAEREQLQELGAKFELSFPEEEPTPPWRTELFTTDEQDTLVELVCDEIRDSMKDVAQEQLDTFDLVECIGYIDPDSEATCLMLTKAKDGLPWMLSTPATVANFATRFGLMDEGDRPVTPLGHDYLQRWGS